MVRHLPADSLLKDCERITRQWQEDLEAITGNDRDANIEATNKAARFALAGLLGAVKDFAAAHNPQGED